MGCANSNLSVPNYINKVLKQFQHTVNKMQNAPYPSVPLTIWSQELICNTKIISTANGCQNQEVHPASTMSMCGKSFYFWAKQSTVNSTLLRPISAIASQSSAPTTDTFQNTMQLLNYLGKQEDAVLSYHLSDMILAVHIDVSYLSEPKALSQAGGHFFLSNDTHIPPNNGAVLKIAHIIKNVISSATEAEVAGLYIMAREAVYIRIILEDLGHKQPSTPLQTMPWRMQWLMVRCNQNKRKPWTCDSNANNNLEYIGNLGRIMQIIGQNITQKHFIETY